MVQQRPPWWPRFSSTLRSTAVTARVGLTLGIAIAVLFVTGLLSHYQYEPWSWLPEPAKPVWGYRLTQGIHVATGIATIPVLLVKLWTVYPNQFRFPPIGSIKHAIERLSVAILVSVALVQVTTGLLNVLNWYPFPWYFVSVHRFLAYVLVGSALLHVGVKLPDIAYGLKAKVSEADVLTEIPWNENPESHSNAGTLPDPPTPGISRRGMLTAAGAGVGVVVLASVGQTVTPLEPLGLIAPRQWTKGPQGVPVNRTAEQAKIAAAATSPTWSLEVVGPKAVSADAGRPRRQGGARGTVTRQLRRRLERGSELARPVPARGGSAGRRHRRVPNPADLARAGLGSQSLLYGGSTALGCATRNPSQRAAAGHRPRLPATADLSQPGRRAQYQVAGPDRGALVKAWRIILAVAGVALAAFGIFRLVSETPLYSLVVLALWLAAALVLHDAILAPSVVGVGWLLRRFVPDRERRFVQVALIMIALVAVIAIPMIFLRGSQPAVKALLLRNYGANLILIIGVIAVVSLLLYAVRIARNRKRQPVQDGSALDTAAAGSADD